MIDKRHKTFVFLFVTFLWSWISWLIALSYIPNGIDEKSFPLFIKLFFIGTYAPSICAILTTLYFEGISQTITLFKKLFIWKFSVFNYLLVLFLPILLTALGIGIYALYGGQIGRFDKNGFWLFRQFFGLACLLDRWAKNSDGGGFYYQKFKKSLLQLKVLL